MPTGNFLYSPTKFVAAIGVRDLIVVETPDALLIVPRDRAQDVAKIVKSLEERKLTKLSVTTFAGHLSPIRLFGGYIASRILPFVPYDCD